MTQVDRQSAVQREKRLPAAHCQLEVRAATGLRPVAMVALPLGKATLAELQVLATAAALSEAQLVQDSGLAAGCFPTFRFPTVM